MPRIRTIKPDAFTSDTLSEVSVLARWTFAGLWTYCDDEGRGRYDPRLIKAALFPIDDRTTTADVVDAISELARIGAVCLYENGGKSLLHCPKWGDHQKVSHAAASKFPACPRDHDSRVPEDLVKAPEDLVKAPEVLRPERNRKEQGKEGSARAGRAKAHEEKFADFWDAYPRKVDKGHAERAWKKLVKDDDHIDSCAVIDAAMRFREKIRNSDPKFIPHASTWLNGQRWLDEEAGAPVADAQGRVVLPPLPKGVFEQ